MGNVSWGQMTEEELWEWMMAGNYPPGFPDMDRLWLVPLERRAFATLTRDVIMVKWGDWDKPDKEFKVKKGTQVQVVMASRMGDVGITNSQKKGAGYRYRTTCIEGEWLVNPSDPKGETWPLKPEGLLKNIKPIEDHRAKQMGCKPWTNN